MATDEGHASQTEDRVMTAQIGELARHRASADPMHPRLETVAFESLSGFAEDDHLAAWKALSRTCRSIARQSPVLRPAVAPDRALLALAKSLDGQAEPCSPREARAFFEQHFQPFRILGAGKTGQSDNSFPRPEEVAQRPSRRAKWSRPTENGFLTGYYEPLVEGSLVCTEEFTEPILQRPDDLVSFPPGEMPFPATPDLSAARQRPGHLPEPYPDRAAIEDGAASGHTRPVVWLRDAIEVFMVQVQGSAKVRLPDGQPLRLTYAGRNGQPYSSIGKILIEEGHIPAAEMSLVKLKGWIRAHGQNRGEAGRALMQRNRSYVFFESSPCVDDEGPIGGAGVPLGALRSIAVDRRIWAYGLPFWIEAAIPWRTAAVSPFRRLMIAQDTGSAILGAARADVFFGSGDAAGHRAGDIRHKARMIVLLPKACGDGE
jgi:membrane-bound lytic murein transglycosylase A